MREQSKIKNIRTVNMCNNLSSNIREALKKVPCLSTAFVLMSLLGTNHICGTNYKKINITFYSYTITSLTCHHHHKVEFSSPHPNQKKKKCRVKMGQSVCTATSNAYPLTLQNVSLSCVYFISFSIVEFASIHESLQLRFITISNDSMCFLTTNNYVLRGTI